MNKFIAILFILALSSAARSQTQKGVTFRSGYDRVGIYQEFDLSTELNDHHQIDFGLRYYSLNYVFEHNIVGMSWGYNYHFNTENDRWFFGPGINAVYFRDKKTSSTLYLTDILVQNKLGYNLNHHWALLFNTSFGVVINKIESYVIGESLVYPFFNYELSLGVRFFWEAKLEPFKKRE